MLNLLKSGAVAVLILGGAQAALAANPMVGGAAMLESRTIVENAVNSADHTTLVAAVQAADLVATLSGPGPFTVFAPTNEAFADLPEGTVDTLLMPANKADLTGVLTYHVVAGKLTAADLSAAIAAGDGVYIMETVNGTKISAQQRGDTIYIGDKSGNNATVTIADVNQSNGVIHVLDRVLLPM